LQKELSNKYNDQNQVNGPGVPNT